MKLTKRNHTNPCKWIAYWNETYYKNKIYNISSNLNARKQEIYSLNIKSNKILKTITEEVHVETKIGSATITPNMMIDYCKKHYPNELSDLCEFLEQNSNNLILPLEQILDSLELTPAYEVLFRFIKEMDIWNRNDIGDLSAFIIFQYLREHAILNASAEYFKKRGKNLFEYYILLKNSISNPKILYTLIEPLAFSHWTIFKTEYHCFPLPDSPVLLKKGNLMIALSPRLLVEIDFNRRSYNGSLEIINKITTPKIHEYKSRAIQNTFKELIFHDKHELNELQKKDCFQKRVQLLRNEKSYIKLIQKELNKKYNIKVNPKFRA